MMSNIKENIYNLVTSTDVNEILLLYLVQINMILGSLKEEIDAATTKVKKASILYNHILNFTPESQYPQFIHALTLSNNSKAVDILETNNESNSTSSVPTGDNKPQTIKYFKLASIFCDDIGFLMHWEAVAKEVLQTKPVFLVPLERTVHLHPPGLSSAVSDLVSDWLSRNGSKATVGNCIVGLEKSTKKDSMTMLIETLNNLYRTTTRVV